MGWFSKNSEDKKKEDSIPELPELPSLPELPKIDEGKIPKPPAHPKSQHLIFQVFLQNL